MLSCIFSGALICSFVWDFFFPPGACYVVRGGTLGVHSGGATQVACVGQVGEGTMILALLSSGFQSLPPLPTSKLGPSGANSMVGGFV